MAKRIKCYISKSIIACIAFSVITLLGVLLLFFCNRSLTDQNTYYDTGICIDIEYKSWRHGKRYSERDLVITLDNGNRYVVPDKVDFKEFEKECLGKEVELRYSDATDWYEAHCVVQLSGNGKAYLTIQEMNHYAKTTNAVIFIAWLLISALLISFAIFLELPKLKEMRRLKQNKKRREQRRKKRNTMPIENSFNHFEQ